MNERLLKYLSSSIPIFIDVHTYKQMQNSSLRNEWGQDVFILCSYDTKNGIKNMHNIPQITSK